MPHPPRSLAARLVPVLVLILAACPVAAQDDPSAGDAQDEVPYGAASSYLIGHQLLREGQAAEALPYLHMAYRAQPGVPVIALDFQEALLAQGYVDDALEVLDDLVAAFPDSASFRFRRSSVLVQKGENRMALADLRHLRTLGEPTLEMIAAEASLLAADGEIGQALDVYRDGLHLFPGSAAEIYLAMSRALQQNGQADAIPDLMGEALAAEPDDPRLRLILIRAEAALGRHERALELAREADRHFGPGGPGGGALPPADEQPPGGVAPGAGLLPGDSYQVELADFYAQHGQLTRAQDILGELAASGELGLGPSLWLGRMLLGTGRLDEAEPFLAELTGRWPASGRAWFLQGKLAEGRQDWPGTVGPYGEAARLAPADPEIRLALVRALLLAREGDLSADDPDSLQAGLRDEFRGHVLAASGLVADQDADGQLVLGYAFRLLDDMKRAAWRFEKAADDQDLRLNALVQASLCLDEAGDPGRARSVLEILRREYPGNPEIANSLGYFLAEKNQDLDQAEALVREALESEPNNGAYLDSLGWVFFRQGLLDEALDYLIRAVNVLPDDPVILEHLGIVLRDLGQAEEARDIFERALRLGGGAERLQTLLEGLDAAGRPEDRR